MASSYLVLLACNTLTKLLTRPSSFTGIASGCIALLNSMFIWILENSDTLVSVENTFTVFPQIFKLDWPSDKKLRRVETSWSFTNMVFFLRWHQCFVTLNPTSMTSTDKFDEFCRTVLTKLKTESTDWCIHLLMRAVSLWENVPLSKMTQSSLNTLRVW